MLFNFLTAKRYLLALSMLICIFLLPGILSAGDISGTVKEKLSGEYVISASVALYKDSIYKGAKPVTGVFTNKYGFFSLPNLKPGKYILVFSRVDKNPTAIDIDLKEDNISLNVEMTDKTTRTEKVVVEAKRELKSTKTISSVEVSTELVSKMPSIGGETDIFRTLQLLPGVQQNSELSSGLYVRGGSPDQNLTLLDGVIVYNPSHLGGFLSSFNADAIRNINLIKGAYPAEYGGRISSVLDMTMKEGTKEKLSGQGGISMISSRLTLEGPLSENSTFMISGRRMYLDLLLSLGNVEDAPQYYFYDWNAKTNIQLGENDRLFISGYFGSDVLNAPKEESGSDDFSIDWGNKTANVRWMHIASSKLFTNFSFIYTNYGFRSNINENDNTTFKTESGIEDLMLKANAEYFPTKNHIIKSGIEAIYHRFKVNTIEGISESIDEFFDNRKDIYSTDVSLYLQDEWTATDRLTTNIGLRANYFASGGYFNVEPRLSATYDLGNQNILKGALAWCHQPMHLLTRSEITLPTDAWIPVSDKIKPAESWQAVLGYQTNLYRDQYTFSVEAYYKHMDNLYEYAENAQFFDADEIEDQLVRGRGKAYGVEFFLNKQVGDFTGWVGYTLAWTKRQFDDLNDGEEFYPRYDRRHDISFVLTYEIGDSWELGLSWVYGTGQAFTLPTGRYYTGIKQDYGYGYYGNDKYVYSKKNEYRMPAYHKLDLNFMHKYEWFGLPFELSINIYNVYNHKNPFALFLDDEWDYENDETTTQLKTITLFPIIPSFGISFKF